MWRREDWVAAVEANMLTTVELSRMTIDPMSGHGFGRVVNVTSGAVKSPIDSLGLSNGARSGLTGFIAGLARNTGHSNVTINNLLPGSFDTDRLRKNFDVLAKKTGKSVQEVEAARVAGVPARRLGNRWEFGQACAFLCSEQASYMTGQNILIDGGAYPGTF